MASQLVILQALLFHDFYIHFLHINLFTELGWEFCGFEQFGIHIGCHDLSMPFILEAKVT